MLELPGRESACGTIPTTRPVPDPAPSPVRRLFSLSGVVPLGAFFVVHAAVNARAVRGDAAFVSAVGALHGIALLPVLEWLFIFAPLALHAGVGVWLVATRRPLADPSPYAPAVRVAVRATGVLALAFLAMHLPELRFRGGARLDGGQLETVLAADLSATFHAVPLRGLAYMLGAGCVAFHFAAGLWGFFAAARRGRESPANLRRAAWGAGAVGMAMWMVLVGIVVCHATGARVLGGTAEPWPTEPCPAPGANGGK